MMIDEKLQELVGKDVLVTRSGRITLDVKGDLLRQENGDDFLFWVFITDWSYIKFDRYQVNYVTGNRIVLKDGIMNKEQRKIDEQLEEISKKLEKELISYIESCDFEMVYNLAQRALGHNHPLVKEYEEVGERWEECIFRRMIG